MAYLYNWVRFHFFCAVLSPATLSTKDMYLPIYFRITNQTIVWLSILGWQNCVSIFLTGGFIPTCQSANSVRNSPLVLSAFAAELLQYRIKPVEWFWHTDSELHCTHCGSLKLNFFDHLSDTFIRFIPYKNSLYGNNAGITWADLANILVADFLGLGHLQQ